MREIIAMQNCKDKQESINGEGTYVPVAEMANKV